MDIQRHKINQLLLEQMTVGMVIDSAACLHNNLLTNVFNIHVIVYIERESRVLGNKISGCIYQFVYFDKWINLRTVASAIHATGLRMTSSKLRLNLQNFIELYDTGN